MRIVLKYFLLFTVLSSFLWFLNKPLFFSVLYSISFFSFLWLIINRLTNILNDRKIDSVMISMALNIGLKFFASLSFVFVMYLKSYFQGNAIILIFVLLYFIYTYLFAHYNKNIDL